MRALALAGALLLAACSDPPPPEVPSSIQTTIGGYGYTTTFSVSGPERATVTWAIGVHDTDEGTVSLPWSRAVNQASPPHGTTVTAETVEGTGAISCKVVVDGLVKAENSSTVGISNRVVCEG